MKLFDRMLILIPVISVIILVSSFFILSRTNDKGRQYMVDAARIEKQIMSGTVPSAEDFPSVTGIYEYDGSGDFFNADCEYLVREINGRLYRIDYTESKSGADTGSLINAGAALILLIVFIMGVLIYIRQNILKQFATLNDVPMQLAKGNLTSPLKENRSRFFGKFIWGLDMLRGELEQSKTNELERARKEKTLLLSLSHDIKTPLAAIKLYSKGISKGIFKDREKQNEAADNIGQKADEIESYLTKMIDSLNNDFMSFEVNMTEFYLSQVMNKVRAYYTDRLSVTGTEFCMEELKDCMISGDPDRLEEVLQNIFENAIKYGDGKRISVSFSDEEDCRLITVSNTGCGLPEQEMNHIFDSFWRGSNSEGKPGSGLGLYICHRLMNEMGGDIFADCSGGTMNVTAVIRKSA